MYIEILFLVMDFGWNWRLCWLIIIFVVIIITANDVDTNLVIFVQMVDIYFDSIQCLNFQIFLKVIMKIALFGMLP